MDHVLVVDDDAELCELLTEYLETEGFTVDTARDGTTGLDRATSGDYGLVVLDVMLPGMNGLEVLRQLRAISSVPVVMLTARGEEVDRIVGLEMGADDYLPKPFNPRELAARIRAIQRRLSGADDGSARAAPGDVLRVGDIEIDPGARTARRDGERVEMTTVEFDVLETLMRAAGNVVSRELLARRVLGREYYVTDRSIDMHVSRIRKKLGPRDDGIERIKGIRGVGYLFVRSSEEGRAGDRSEGASGPGNGKAGSGRGPSGARGAGSP
jgi:two-component system response regulator CpxR